MSKSFRATVRGHSVARVGRIVSKELSEFVDDEVHVRIRRVKKK